MNSWFIVYVFFSKIFLLVIIFIAPLTAPSPYNTLAPPPLIISIFFILLLGLKKEQNYIPESKLSIIKNNISFKTLYSEEKIFLNDLLKEKPYNLINIWASWCAPCKEEHPYLIELSFNDRINLVGINYKDNIKNAKNFP